MPPAFAELVCRSAFSFREGASDPERLIEVGASLGLSALAITDRDAVYGLPRAHKASRDTPGAPRLLCGALLTVEQQPGLALIARDGVGWAHLCRILTRARCGGAVEEALVDADRAEAALQTGQGRPGVEKGRARLPIGDLLERARGLEAILLGDWSPGAGRSLREAFGEALSVGVSRRLDGQDERRVAQAQALGQALGCPLVATNDVLMARREDKPLQDVLTAIRLGTTVQMAGRTLQANAERHLRSPRAMAALFADHPDWIEQSLIIADRVSFTLASLAYRYPREVTPEGRSPQAQLAHLCEVGQRWRYPQGVPDSVRHAIAHELAVIERLGFATYFLTVHDVVRFATDRGILCQGRGSAANSAVCFVLGVTAVDPAHSALLFERFISEERGEPPDIDIDFEHERREEVMQYVYQRYGRHRAGMVSEVISWRRKSAVRDVGKALGLSLDQVDALARSIQWFDKGLPQAEQLASIGLDAADRRVALTIELADALRGLPRHVGIHVGGFTISDGPLVELVPIEPARMEDRTIIQWDKDDIDIVGFVKVDLLSLGMLTAIRKAFGLIEDRWGRALNLATVPNEDPATYEMLSRADSVGVFQIESRAQMSMLPRLKPRTFYDLVVQVAIVRPGPIQGGMVHPYLRRRRGEEEVAYPHDALRPILERTLGVPIFQEQVMAMAIEVGGYSAGEADQLRRAMGAWRKRGGLEPHRKRLIEGMTGRGIAQEFAERIAAQIEGFAEYGFPESHAASFARLVYVSSWLKRWFPAALTAGLINAQPMGFYSPRALLADARRHGVSLRPISLSRSAWDLTLEPDSGTIEVEGQRLPAQAIRLGFRLIRGLREEAVAGLVEARAQRPFADLADLARRTPLRKDELALLARADVLGELGMDRRQALWATKGLYDLPLFSGLLRRDAEAPALRPPSEAEALQEDFATTGISLDRDPTGIVREELRAAGVKTAIEVLDEADGAIVKIAGLVSNRQRPGTASGIVFMTLEDETGMLNLVIKPERFAAQRELILGTNQLRATARVQRDGDAVSLLVLSFAPFTAAPRVAAKSRDFH